MIARAALILTAVTTAAASAAPAEDPDLAREAHSRFWDEVAHPERAARRTRLDDAVRAMRPQGAALDAALRDLEALTAEDPTLAAAWGYLAIAAERRRQWGTCATAYARAFALDPRWQPLELLPPNGPGHRALTRAPTLSIVLCQTRSGDFVGARATVEAAIARGETGSELWLRAGEVALAQGRLDDAIDLLARSTEDAAPWLLTMAFDRARRDADADATAARAAERDALAVRAASGALPLAPASDADYLLGIAAAYRGQPDFAVVHLRRYLAAVDPGSPWRARALEHIAAAAARRSPTTVVGAGGAPAMNAALVAVAEHHADRLAACMAAVPTGLAELRVTVTGPPRPTPPRPAPPRGASRRRRPPVPDDDPDPSRQAGVSAYYLLAPHPSTDPDARDRALRCLETAGRSIPLPAAAAGTWATLRIPVRAR